MATSINYKPLVEEKFEEFKKQHPDYSYGQIIYSAAAALKKVKTRADFLDLSDEDLYTGLEKALRLGEAEKEEEIFVK